MIDDYECGRSSGEKEEGDKCDSEPVPNFTKAHVAYIMENHFFMQTALASTVSRTL
jgi:hypothetical protein